ncbi:MAG: ABC transporter permease [Lachnoclostridium sp.]|jgi:spermidine/putrescine transport system permease protein|nr:ABC transporter permease [Lachnoclostridium sp.]
MIRFFTRKQLGIPYIIFLVFFVIMPVIVLLYYAFTNASGHFTAENLLNFFRSTNTIGTLFYSLVIALTTTLICLLIAYPVAYILAKSNLKRHTALILLFIVPMWINFTLRITALMEVLSLWEGNLAWHPFLNTVIGLTYDYLPFMILPIYLVLLKIDDSYSEAAADLGASPFKVFIKIILPLSLPGVISGNMMVFLPSMTNYVVLDMMHNSTYIMGSLIGSYFNNYDWNNGSMISIVLLLIIVTAMIFTNRLGDEQSNRRGVW